MSEGDVVALGVALLIILFISADVGVRIFLSRIEAGRKRDERLRALDNSIKLTFASEAKTLRRVEVAQPLARILAVDDEAIILDSLRKILVLGGYSVDTVENGSEALTLLKENNYDFVFTDLKMPEMNGVEVVKAVKQLRPEIDVIVVTGYASIETAIETMKVGAMDYIQKPFTEDELLKLVNGFVIKRQERIAQALVPKLHVVTPSTGEIDGAGAFRVMSGIFIAPGHSWAAVEPNGAVKAGLDDFAQKALGQITAVELPQEDKTVAAGKPLFAISRGELRAEILAPVSGKVTSINYALQKSPEMLNSRPYDSGWICRIEPSNLASELASLKIGSAAVSWYEDEVKRYAAVAAKHGSSDAAPAGRWNEIAKEFLSTSAR